MTFQQCTRPLLPQLKDIHVTRIVSVRHGGPYKQLFAKNYGYAII